MNGFSAKCCVCFVPSENVVKLDNCDTKGASVKHKLHSVVPEVEWLEEYSICTQCVQQLNVAYEFRNHCIQVDESCRKNLIPKLLDEIFRCYHCEVSFNDKQILTEHIQSNHFTQTPNTKQTDKQYKCESCERKYFTEKGLKIHMKACESADRKSNPRRKFSCEVCGSVFGLVKHIVAHCASEHAMDKKRVKPYTCSECPMRFTTSANLLQHTKYHRGSRTHICSFCGKSYITQNDLTVHEYTHFNRRNYRCEFCVKAFNTNKNLRSHILVVHTDASLWKYCCEVCKKRFPLKSGHAQHMRRHAGDKPFACHICEKSFVSRSELRKHMGFHSMVRPHKCAHCGKAYKEKNVFAAHLARVHGIGDAKVPVKAKNFACDVCPNAFCDRQKLERHLRTHSGVKPYMCSKCDKKFSDKYYLKQHRKNVHSLEDEDDTELRTYSLVSS